MLKLRSRIRRAFLDGNYALHATNPDGSTRISTYLAPQGSIVPTPVGLPGTFFSYNAGGLATGQMWVSFGWSTTNLTRADGSTLSIPGPPAAPGAPSLSQVAGGITRGALTLFARVCYVKLDPTSGTYLLYPVSGEANFAVSANNRLVVAHPPANSAFDGWVALVNSTTNLEFKQDIKTDHFATDWTEPGSGFAINLTQWSASWKNVTIVDLPTSTDTYSYPFYDAGGSGLIRFGVGTGAQNASAAAQQNADGHVQLSYLDTVAGTSAMKITTPGAGGSGSGNKGGGRFT